MVAMECTPDRDLLLIQIPVAKMKRSIVRAVGGLGGVKNGCKRGRGIATRREQVFFVLCIQIMITSSTS